MSETREISGKIDEIIAARKARKSLLDKRIQDLDAAIAAAQEIESLKNSVIGQDGTLMQDSPYYGIFADNVKMLSIIGGVSAAPFIKDAQELREEYVALNSRFQRDFINIAVAGLARQGKSQLLQSISGLDSRCIPAFDGDHCTGASSTIENGENEHVKVLITYKTKEDILEEAKGYLDIISNETEGITSIDDLPQFTQGRLYQMLERVTTRKADAAAKSNIFFTRYVEHFSEWRGLIGKEPEWMDNEDTIMTYVAQHNGLEEPDKERYFKFVGVKSARIIKKFSYHDAGKIKLVDTVGLGDTATDTDTKMLETIKSDSDAVMFFKLPDPNVGGSPDDRDIEICDQVREAFEYKRMDKWFVFILNHTRENLHPKKPKKPRLDNLARCIDYKKEMDHMNHLPAIMNQIVDVADEDEVREHLLVPLLRALLRNLGEIDQLYVDMITPLAERTWRAYDMLCKSVEGLAKYSAGGNLTNEIYRLIRKTYDGDLTVQLRNLNRRYGEARGEECEILRERVDGITKSLMDIVPSEETVQGYIDSHGATSIAEVYKHFLDAARSDITQQFIEVDTSLKPIITAFKNEVTRILTENGQLGKILPPSDEGELFLWMRDFKQAHLEPDSQIGRAFEFLYEFDFTVRGALMHKVRMSLYEISLANPNMMNVSFNSASAESVVFHLTVALKGVQDKLKNALGDFYMSPNEALFAVCDEFFERISTAEGVYDEWFALYSSFSGRIWSRELMANEKNGAAAETWTANIERLQKYNRKDSFILNLE